MHLICVTGPPAVGKMTVGRAVCDLTGFRLFHNHMSIEPLLGVYDFGTPSFRRINAMIRREVIAESVVAGLPGLVFTFAIDLDDPRELEQLQELVESVERAGAPVDVVELCAPQHVRLAREGGADRMDHKRSKRDVDWARAHVVDLESRARFTTDPARDGERLLPGHRHLRLDNDHADARRTAERIVTELGLARL
ncbi:AAA family ATPase [Terrabacter sp. 2YAF2]|uniref:AAA family ATPase n=1 Tax=Terrabacter sp. 2YAF2 TaxID=3233026 RepID=UPI003F982407